MAGRNGAPEAYHLLALRYHALFIGQRLPNPRRYSTMSPGDKRPRYRRFTSEKLRSFVHSRLHGEGRSEASVAPCTFTTPHATQLALQATVLATASVASTHETSIAYPRRKQTRCCVDTGRIASNYPCRPSDPLQRYSPLQKQRVPQS